MFKILTLLLIILIIGCTNVKEQPDTSAVVVEETASSEEMPKTIEHTIKQGENLSMIARQYGISRSDIIAWNNIENPDYIRAGDVVIIKLGEQEVVDISEEPIEPPSEVEEITETVVEEPALEVIAEREVAGITWRWPHEGKVITYFEVGDPHKKGINIKGTRGDAIVSAADGQVVYVGDIMPNLGNLIVIKHSDTYVSVYAHNDKLLVKENETVTMGQHIADMGDSDASQVMLHFEIRKEGISVDPLDYLPRK